MPLVSHLAHVELFAPDPADAIHDLIATQALAFVAADGRSAYLRGSDDRLSYSLKVTDAPALGVGHVAWRSRDAQALSEAVAMLAASGRGLGWTPGDVGHGPAYRFQGPSGHVHELLWEAEAAPADVRATALACLDHVTLACAHDPERDATFFVESLGYRRWTQPSVGVRLSATGEAPELAFLLAADGVVAARDRVVMRLAPLLTELAVPTGLAIEAMTTVSPAFP